MKFFSHSDSNSFFKTYKKEFANASAMVFEYPTTTAKNYTVARDACEVAPLAVGRWLRSTDIATTSVPSIGIAGSGGWSDHFRYAFNEVPS